MKRAVPTALCAIAGIVGALYICALTAPVCVQGHAAGPAGGPAAHAAPFFWLVVGFTAMIFAAFTILYPDWTLLTAAVLAMSHCFSWGRLLGGDAWLAFANATPLSLLGAGAYVLALLLLDRIPLAQSAGRGR